MDNPMIDSREGFPSYEPTPADWAELEAYLTEVDGGGDYDGYLEMSAMDDRMAA